MKSKEEIEAKINDLKKLLKAITNDNGILIEVTKIKTLEWALNK